MLDVLGREPHVGRGERDRERVDGGIEPEAVGVVADALEHGQHRGALGVDRERAFEDAGVARAGVAGLAQERDELVAQALQQRAQLGGRETGLEVVEQHVVRVGVALEARDVGVAQIDVAGERVAERREVVRRARLEPGLLALDLGAREVGGERGRHAHRLLEVAAQPADEPDVVGVGVLAVRPRLERVEQPAETGVGLARVDELGQRGAVLGAAVGAGRRHHRLLVPEQQAADRVEVAQLRCALAQRGELGGRAHRPARSYTSSSSASASGRLKCSAR